MSFISSMTAVPEEVPWNFEMPSCLQLGTCQVVCVMQPLEGRFNVQRAKSSLCE